MIKAQDSRLKCLTSDFCSLTSCLRASASLALGLTFLAGAGRAAETNAAWSVVKGKHFLVYYQPGDAQLAEKTVALAEAHCERIRKELRFVKRDDFWTWDNRVKVFIHPSREAFQRATGAPEWAGGRSSVARKEIASYSDDREFPRGALPHEIAHLVLRDFVGFKGEIPVWLNEGVAQWADSDRREDTLRLARELAARHTLTPLRTLAGVKDTRGLDAGQAAGLYAQAVSLVGYLIQTHGAESFHTLCAQIRDGKDLDAALKFTYPGTLRTIEDLEKAWKTSLGTAP